MFYILCSSFKIIRWAVFHANVICLGVWVYPLWSLLNFLLQNLCLIVLISDHLRICFWLSWEMISFSWFFLCWVILYYTQHVLNIMLEDLKSSRKFFCFSRRSTQLDSYHKLCLFCVYGSNVSLVFKDFAVMFRYAQDISHLSYSGTWAVVCIVVQVLKTTTSPTWFSSVYAQFRGNLGTCISSHTVVGVQIFQFLSSLIFSQHF